MTVSVASYIPVLLVTEINSEFAMRAKKPLTAPTNRQQGVSLIVALIMLLIITAIGISVMDTSISKLRMTSGIREQSLTSNHAEDSLTVGEQRIINGLAFGSGDFFEIGDNVMPYQAVTWTSANVTPDLERINNNQNIIQYLGDTPTEGATVKEGGPSKTSGDKVHVYRVTARSESANGTTRMFQSLFFRENGPN